MQTKSNVFFKIGRTKVVELLIKNGANVNSKDNNDSSALNGAAVLGMINCLLSTCLQL